MTAQPTKSVTQAEVARILGIHQTTVSAILSGKRAEKFAPEMRERVEAAARQLGYRPSVTARMLRGARSGLIGVFHFGRDKDIESHRLHQIVSAIHKEGYKPLAMPMGPKVMWLSQRDEISACTVMLDAKVEGLVLSGFADDFDLGQLKRFQEMGIPVVSVAGIKLPGVPFFGADRRQASYELTTHLIHHGRKRLICLHRWPSKLMELTGSTAFDAVEGFRQAAQDNGLTMEQAIPYIKPPLTETGMHSYAAGEQAFAEIWESGARPDAVLCYDDNGAIGVYGYCQRHGIRIPDDVAIVGYENQRICDHLHPRLTSVSMPDKTMAEKAIQCLIRNLAKKDMVASSDKAEFIPCSLVIRESCGGGP